MPVEIDERFRRSLIICACARTLRAITSSPWLKRPLAVVVHATAIGIDPDFLPKLGIEFTQGSEGYAREFEGLGLGLALARRYVALLGARLEIRSNIFSRDQPDAAGVVAPRLSANLSILDKATRTERHDKVFVGSVVALGADRYRVERAEEGKNGGFGRVVLRRLP